MPRKTGGLAISSSRETFVTLFLLLILVLLFFPLISTFNDILTRIVMSLKGYVLIRDYIAPFEARSAAVILALFGMDVAVSREYLVLKGAGETFAAEIIWNCIGWQSILFFIICAFVGFQGNKYTNFSKFKAFLIGAFGTYLINIVRIALVVMVAYWFGQVPATIVHDYGAILAVIGWLFFFWWFAYGFVLEDKVTN